MMLTKMPYLLHMVDQGTQDIYDTKNVEECEATLKTSLEALDQHLCIKKNIPFERFNISCSQAA